MANQWAKVHVFISSTFNDMHAERDYLVKSVFPELAEWCERRKLRLVDIDLRWGVTEQDALHNKNVVKVCLERIDDCRPFFLCFLGQRRGWVPGRDEISPETFEAFPDLKDHTGTASITEMEILHALISPLHQGRRHDPRGPAESFEPAKHAFFYLRDGGYLERLPKDVPQLREIYTNEGVRDPVLRARQDETLERWREDVIPECGRSVRTYAATWDADAETPELMIPLECPSAEAESIVRWQQQWARAGVTVMAMNVADIPAEAAKARAFNEKLAAGRLAGFRVDGRTLADVILHDMQAAIATRFPDHTEVAEETDLQRELDQQEQFLFTSSEGFIERGDDFAELDAYLEGSADVPFVLSAAAGMGKSTLLANWVERTRRRAAGGTGPTVHVRFVGASDHSTTVYSLLQYLLRELREVYKVQAEIPDDPQELREAFPEFLAAAGRQGRMVIVLDGLNQLATGLGDLSWLPLRLPPGVRLVVSFKDEADGARDLVRRLSEGGQAILARLPPFDDEEDRRRLVEAYLSQYLKDLDERHLQALIRSPGARNPLYLKVLLSELRVFGAFGELGTKIREDFGDTPASAFDGVLRRLETDPAYTPIDPAAAVPLLFGLLAHARRGLSVEELSAIFQQELPLGSRPQRQAAADTVHLFLRQVRPFLARRDGRYDFFFESFRLAARQRYVAGEAGEVAPTLAAPKRPARDWHRPLAVYFGGQPTWLEEVPGTRRAPNARKVSELPHHLAWSERAERLVNLLTDYQFLAAKVEAAGPQPLFDDFSEATAPPATTYQTKIAPHKPDLELIQGALRLSAHTLGRGSDQLAGQLLGRLQHEKTDRVQALLREAAEGSRTPWLRPLRPSLTPPGGSMSRTLEAHAGSVEALAVFDGGRRAITGGEDAILVVWDLEKERQLRRLAGHSDTIRDVVAYVGGRRAISASKDGTLKVWDLDSGRALQTLTGHTDAVTTVAVTASGRYALSGSKDRTLRVWDLERGDLLQTLEGHTAAVNAVAVSTDGQRAFSGSSDKTLRMWDLSTGQELRTLEYKAGCIWALSLFDGDRRAISASSQGRLTIWNLETGEQEVEVDAHLGPVQALAVYGSGRRALSGGLFTGDIRVWDLQTGEQLLALEGYTDSVTRLAVSGDGRRLIAAGEDGSLRLLALEAGDELLRTIRDRHAIAFSRDGRRALSIWGHDNNQLQVWDLASGQEEHTLTGHVSSITGAAVFDDGRRAITTSWDPSLDPSLIVWDLQRGLFRKGLVGHRAAIYAVAVFPDGRRAASGAWDKTLRIWDLETGQEIHTLAGHSDSVNAVAVYPDGQRVISGSDDGTLKVWDAESGAELFTLIGHTDAVGAVTVSRDGTRALSGSQDSTLRLWDLRSGQGIRTLSGHDADVTAVGMFAGGRLAISASIDSNLKVWDLERGVALRTLTAHSDAVDSVTVLSDGRRAISTGYDHTIRVWSLDSVSALASSKAHSGEVERVMVLPDGGRAVSISSFPTELRGWDLATGAESEPPVWQIGSDDRVKVFSPTGCAVSVSVHTVRVPSFGRKGTLSVWDLADGRELGSVEPDVSWLDSRAITPRWTDARRVLFSRKDSLLAWDLVQGGDPRELTPDVMHGSAPINALAVYAGGQRAISADADGKLRVWDLERGHGLYAVQAHQDSVTAVAMMSDGTRAVSASKDGTICLWDLERPHIQMLATLAGYQQGVLGATLVVGGRHALWGCGDGTINVWDLEAAPAAYTLTGHTGRITGLAVNSAGQRAVSCSWDRTVRVWDLGTREGIVAFAVDGGIEDCDLAPDGKTVIAGDRLGQVHVLRLEDGATPR